MTDRYHIKGRRFWTGFGFIILGIVISITTFISVIGPIMGVIMMILGLVLMLWSARTEQPQDSSVVPNDPRSRHP